MLIPLTPSVYVAGKLAEQDRVLVDIGTGYFVEKDCKGADEYYVRKVKYLQEQLGMLGQVLADKRQSFNGKTCHGHCSNNLPCSDHTGSTSKTSRTRFISKEIV
jgi:hypothetical protein